MPACQPATKNPSPVSLHAATAPNRMAKLSAQFIRTLRNHLFSTRTVLELILVFTATLGNYL